jgi:hypothetical protein
MTSPVIEEFLVLKEENLSEEEQRRNWFSFPSVIDVYSAFLSLLLSSPSLSLSVSVSRAAAGQYLQLDSDRNGMLSRVEFSRFQGGGLTAVFVNRVFEELPTFKGELVRCAPSPLCCLLLT